MVNKIANKFKVLNVPQFFSNRCRVFKIDKHNNPVFYFRLYIFTKKNISKNTGCIFLIYFNNHLGKDKQDQPKKKFIYKPECLESFPIKKLMASKTDNPEIINE